MVDQSKTWNIAKKAISKSNPLLGAAINVAEGIYKGVISSDQTVSADYERELEYIKSCLSELKGKPDCYIDEYNNEKIFKKFAKKFNIQDSEKILVIIDESVLFMTDGVVFTDAGMYASVESLDEIFLSYNELYNSEIDANYGSENSTVTVIKDDIKYQFDITEENSAKLLYSVLARIKEYTPCTNEIHDNNAEKNVSFKDNELGYAGMIRTFLSNGSIENNRNLLNSLMNASNISVERAKEIEEIIKCQSFKDNELGYVGMLKSFIEQGTLEQNRQLLVTLANCSNISTERAKEIENIICEAG